MTWFCPSCFAELPGQDRRCPRCGTDPAAVDQGFEAALIGALRHRLHDRRLVAAHILGARRVAAAVPALIAAAGDGDDPYLAAEAARALVASARWPAAWPRTGRWSPGRRPGKHWATSARRHDRGRRQQGRISGRVLRTASAVWTWKRGCAASDRHPPVSERAAAAASGGVPPNRRW
jgi:hypothetical protein